MTDESEPGDEAPVRTILTLTHKDMVRIGLSSNTALFFLVLLGPLIDQLESRIDELIEGGALNLFTGGVEVTLLSGTIIAIAALLAFLLLLMVVSILGAFLRYFGFRLDRRQRRASLQWRVIDATRALGTIRQGPDARGAPGPLLLFSPISNARETGVESTAGQKALRYTACTHAHRRYRQGDFRRRVPDVDIAPVGCFPDRLAVTSARAPDMAAPAPSHGRSADPDGVGQRRLAAWIPVYTLGVWIPGTSWLISRHGLVLRRGLIGFRIDAFLYRKVQRIGITQTPCSGATRLRRYASISPRAHSSFPTSMTSLRGDARLCSV